MDRRKFQIKKFTLSPESVRVDKVSTVYEREHAEYFQQWFIFINPLNDSFVPHVNFGRLMVLLYNQFMHTVNQGVFIRVSQNTHRLCDNGAYLPN